MVRFLSFLPLRLIQLECVLGIYLFVGGHPKHPEAEETAGQIGAGLRFCQSKVCPFTAHSLSSRYVCLSKILTQLMHPD